MNPRTMQKRSTEAQIRKYGSLEAFREEMRRRASMRKKVGNFRKVEQLFKVKQLFFQAPS